jgi:hypothetical protein
MNRKQIVTVATVATVAALAVVGAAAWYLRAPDMTESLPTPDAAARQSERKVLFWHDPMFPGTKFDKPGKSPFMDMQLVPVYQDETGGAASVSIRPEVINSLGVRTYKIEYATHARRLTTDGYLFRAEGGATLRVLVDIFDRDANWVRPGLPAEVRVLDVPERRWEATVESVRTDIDVGTRSLKATLRLKQIDPALKPNMFAQATISAAPAGKKLFVPREALIRTGTRTAVVLALGEGRFQPADVVAGAEHGEWIEILQGIKDGDVVVTSGQFLIDSEASLRASLQRLEAPAANGTEKKP